MGIRMTNIATPMPQPRAKFTNKLGLPLSGGKVYTYEPGTDIPKKTWRDVDKSVENTNPIQLDAAGEADIYGVGFYRVVVKDFFELTIYDVEKTGIAVELDASFVVDASGKNQQQINDEQQQFNNSVTTRVASVLLLRSSPVKAPIIHLESYIEGLYKGGQNLYWDNASTESDDGVSCFAVTGVTTGRWKSVNIGLLTAYHAGAIGNDSNDDTAALQRYATFCRTKQVPMNLEYGKWAISSTIQCGSVYGISNKGGSIRMLASVDGFIINGVSRGALLEKFTFKSDVANVNDKATIVFDITTGHIFGMIFSGYTFNNTGNTWVGIDVKSSTNSIYGLFGGTSFMNLQTLRLKHAMRFSDGAHFINSVIFKNSFHSYDTLAYKIDKTLVGCVFDHVYGQECVTAIVQLLKAAERTAFSNMHNWDTLSPTILINDSCNNLEFRNILLNEIRGFGYKCVYPETYQLKNLASATSVDIWTRFYHSTKADFMRLFNAEEVMGTATITDGRYHPSVQTWSAGLNPTGIMFSTKAANDVANLTYYSKTNTLTNTRVALLERYVTATFSYQFKLTSIDLDNYSFFVGVQGYNDLTAGNFYGYAIGVTNIAGNLVLVKRAISNSAAAAYNATDLTVISVLGALSVSTVEIGMRINTDTGNIGAVWYNGALLGGADLSGLALQNKTPIVHVKQVSAKPVNLFLKNAYLQVHSNQQ